MSMQQEQWQNSQQSQRYQHQLRASGLANKPPLSIDAVIPSEQHARQVVQQFTQDESVKRVEYRRDRDGTPHVRIELHPETHPSQFREKIESLTQAVEQSYQTATSRFQS